MRPDGNARSYLVVLIVTAALVLGACQPATPSTPEVITERVVETVEVEVPVEVPAEEEELTQILFRQAWLPDDIYVPYMVALDLGYYEEEGIDFVNQIGSGTGTSTRVVGAGSSQLGKGEAAGVIQAVLQDIPVTAIALEFQNTPASIVTLADSNIESLQDLEGATVATLFDTASHSLIVAGLTLAGVDTEAVNFINLGPAQWNTALMAGDVDAINAYFSNQPVDLEAAGADIRVFRMMEVGLNVPSQTLFVNNEFLAENPELVEGFLRATTRGYKYTMQNPEEAVQIMAKYYPDIDPDLILQKLMLDFEVYQSAETAENGFGWQDSVRWENTQQMLLDTGLIEDSRPVDEYFTNSVLEAIDLEVRTLDQ